MKIRFTTVVFFSVALHNLNHILPPSNHFIHSRESLKRVLTEAAFKAASITLSPAIVLFPSIIE
jgi:hypothetical protein